MYHIGTLHAIPALQNNELVPQVIETGCKPVLLNFSWLTLKQTFFLASPHIKNCLSFFLSFFLSFVTKQSRLHIWTIGLARFHFQFVLSGMLIYSLSPIFLCNFAQGNFIHKTFLGEIEVKRDREATMNNAEIKIGEKINIEYTMFKTSKIHKKSNLITFFYY